MTPGTKAVMGNNTLFCRQRLSAIIQIHSTFQIHYPRKVIRHLFRTRRRNIVV